MLVSLAAVTHTGGKAIHWRSGKILAQWVEGTLCSKPLSGARRLKEKRSSLWAKAKGHCRQLGADADSLCLVAGGPKGRRPREALSRPHGSARERLVHAGAVQHGPAISSSGSNVFVHALMDKHAAGSV